MPQLRLYYQTFWEMERDKARILMNEYADLHNRSARATENEGWVEIVNEDGSINRDAVEQSKMMI